LAPEARIVVLGARGQLGQEFLRVLGRRGVGWGREQLELADTAAPAAMARALERARPAVVINTAAFNYVDLAETRRQEALAVNFTGPAHLARLAAVQGWTLVHFSTDYVFGGDGLSRPRVESDAPAPMNFYGYSKLLGEQAVLRTAPGALVARVAHLYGGASQSSGRLNLVQRFMAQARAGEAIRVTRGQTLNPTSVQDVVPAVLALLDGGAAGLFHLTGEGECTAREFAEAVLRLAGGPVNVTELERDPRPTLRPLYTVLENRRWAQLSLPPLPAWQASLAAYVAQLTGRKPGLA